MKKLSISLTDEQAKYIIQFAKKELISISESARQVIELGVKCHSGKTFLMSQKIKVIENRLDLLKDYIKKDLDYQNDSLKQETEDT